MALQNYRWNAYTIEYKRFPMLKLIDFNQMPKMIDNHFVCLLICFVLNDKTVFGRDNVTVRFLREYIRNEWSPTTLHYDLCWEKETQIHLSRTLMEDGVQVSSSLKKHSKQHDHVLLFLTDLNCAGGENAFNDTDLLRFPYHWLALYDANSEINENIYDKLSDLPLLVDSDFVLAERKGDIFTLTERHKPSPNGTTLSNPKGVYNGTLVDVRPRRELFWRRKDIMGHILTMSNVIQNSNSTKYHLPREDRLELKYDAMTKLCWSHIRTTFSVLNATPRYIFSYRWGYIKDGQWSGMINDLRIGKADIGTNCLANAERTKVIVFADCISRFELKFAFRQPLLSSTSNVFALPFSLSVWVAIIVSLVISTGTIYLATKWETRRLSQDPSQLDGTVIDALLLTLSALSQQGCSKEPKGLSGRIMLWVVFTNLMSLYAAYSANIVVLLQAPAPEIRNPKELLESGMTLSANDADYSRFIFKLFNDSGRGGYYKKIVPSKGPPHFYSNDEGVKRIREGFFAYHGDIDTIRRRVEETFYENEKCDLREVDYMKSRYPLVPIRKDSPYLELLKVAIKRVTECGIQSALHGRLMVPKPKCSNDNSMFASVSILNLRPVLFFLLYGIALSVFICLLEILDHKIKSRKLLYKNQN